MNDEQTREGWTRHRIEVTRRGLILHTARDIRHALADRFAEADLEWGAQHDALADGVITAHLDTLMDILEGARGALEAERDDLRDKLRQILDYTRAYPVDIFPEPDIERTRDALEAAGVSMGALHASWARRVLRGVAELAEEAPDGH